jgi:hypothetical protein
MKMKKERKHLQIYKADADTELIREAFEREGHIRLEELGVGKHTHFPDVVPRVWTQEPGREVCLLELGCDMGILSVSRVSSLDSSSIRNSKIG